MGCDEVQPSKLIDVSEELGVPIFRAEEKAKQATKKQQVFCLLLA
jgi:hypothetical protein